MRLLSVPLAIGASLLFANPSPAETVIYSQDFDVGVPDGGYFDADASLGAEWTFYQTNEGQARIYGWGGFRDDVLILDDAVANSTYSLSEATLTLDLTGYTDVTLSFNHYDSSDEDDPIESSPYTGHPNKDGVSVSSDGITWYLLTNFVDELGNNQPNGSWWSYGPTGAFTVEIPSISSLGLALTSTFQIKFQQYDNYPHGHDGRKFDNLVVAGTLDSSSQSPVPEPASVALFGLGLCGVGFQRYRRRRRNSTASSSAV